ncbi:MAG: bifunctional diguanylate cyclase/phosphodiesterase [Clostridiales bacterium]|nr:bifunctional diguanylate cyclase/phosphodiesterase [Clostridiales bacterium]
MGNGFVDLFKQYYGVVIGVIAVVAVIIVFLVLRSAKKKKRSEAKQRFISDTETNELKGLLEKNDFYKCADRLYKRDPGKPMKAIVLNIEQFHSVNALYGREFGDQILSVICIEIRDFLIEQDGIACQMEADCFAIYCSTFVDARALLTRLENKLDMISTDTGIMLRMGVMPWKENTEPRQLVEQALFACNLARGQYDNRLIVFDESVREHEEHEQRLINDLSHTINNNEFIVRYQPKFDITVDPPRLKSAEALVRWVHPELGMIPPNDFIPLFERNGQIGQIDQYVWGEVARQIAQWREEYGVTIPISVNLSRIDVFDQTLDQTLDSIIKKNGLDASSLQLEVTESAYLENTQQFIGVIDSLRKKGFHIEMDDFGSGYSSPGQLSSLSIDVLKMNRALIKHFEYSKKDMQFVKQILEIAKSLGISVIAGGVETQEQLQLLKEYGCEMAQGYFLSPPLPPEDFALKYIEK